MSETKELSIIEKLSAPLEKEDIEFRIGNISQGKGFSLLAYKTARTDVKRLNSALGFGWKNRFQYDSKGILCCEISIFDKDTKEWITRIDVGTESNTEKEKGNYSDAFKRAGFKFGIGIELYNFPFIWISWDNWYDKNGKSYPSFFNAGDLRITEYENINGEVEKLTILHKRDVIFSIGGNNQQQENTVQKISEIQLDYMLEFIQTKENVDVAKMCSFLQIKSLKELPSARYEEVMNMIKKKSDRK